MILLKPSKEMKCRSEFRLRVFCHLHYVCYVFHYFLVYFNGNRLLFKNFMQYGLPLQIVSYKDLYGWTMDEIVKMIGLKNNCTFCGVFRRQVFH